MTNDEDRYAFAHDLIRETPLARLGPAETRARHTAILAPERLPGRLCNEPRRALLVDGH